MRVIEDRIDEEMKNEFTTNDYIKIVDIVETLIDKGYLDESMREKAINVRMKLTLEQRENIQ